MAGYLERIKKLEQSKKEKMMEVKLTYTVEAIGRPYGASESIPWGDAKRHEGLTERKAIKCYNDYWHWYHPDSNSYSGHVRIVGTRPLSPRPCWGLFLWLNSNDPGGRWAAPRSLLGAGREII